MAPYRQLKLLGRVIVAIDGGIERYLNFLGTADRTQLPSKSLQSREALDREVWKLSAALEGHRRGDVYADFLRR